MSRRYCQVSKVPGRRVFNLRGQGFKGIICNSSLKFQGSRTSGVKGSRDPGSIVRFKVLGGHPSWASCFKGTNGPYVSGFRGIEGFPLVSRAFKGFDVFKIQRLQGLREAEFKAPRSKGKRVEGLLGSHGSKGSHFIGPKGSSNSFVGDVGRPVLACLL